MNDIFSGLAVVLGLAAFFGVMAKFFRQPAILGYVLAGIILTSFGGRIVNTEFKETLEVLGKLGVTFLLFLVGLELPVSQLKKMGKVALATGLGQILFTGGMGMLIATLVGYVPITAMYIGIAFAFSSTIIVVKLLSEKKELSSLHGKISVGFLLVQDFVAIGLFVILSGLQVGSFAPLTFVFVVLKAVILVGLTMLLATKIVPRILDKLARSGELLFVSALGWCLVVSAVVGSSLVGFNVEIGGFLAGLALANASENLQIVARIRPIRDFFLTVFFVWLGSTLSVNQLSFVVFPALIFSVFVLIGNPIIMMTIMGLMGFKKRTSFLAGLNVGQISEFSLILVSLAVRTGYANSNTMALATLVGIITMTLSTYMISNSEKIYTKVSRYLNVFERKKSRVQTTGEQDSLKNHILLFGHNRTGSKVLPALENFKSDVVIVDFNPQTIEELRLAGKNAVFGDVGDLELYDEIGLSDARMVVSTVPVLEDNLQLLAAIKRIHKKMPVILTAQDEHDSQQLYKHGASYVLVPQTIGGEFLAHMIGVHGENTGAYRKDNIL